jgi:hypothetical protein
MNYKLTPAPLPEKLAWGLRHNKTKNQIVLEDFVASGADCVRYEGWEHLYWSSSYCVGSLNDSAKRYGLPVKARQRDGKVYLTRTDDKEKSKC